MEPKIIKKNSINNQMILGIQILRMLFSLFILLRHCYNENSYEKFFNYFPFRVYTSTFFMISFYFSYNCFISRNVSKITQRLIRVFIPYLIWPYIFYIKDLAIRFYFFKSIKIEFKFLFYQLIIGCGIHNVFWFQFNLIFVSLLFIIIILLFKNKYILILSIIGIFSYIFKYFGYNDKILKKYNDITQISIKYIGGAIVLALTGFLLSSVDIISLCKKQRKKVIYKFIIFLFLIKIFTNLILSNFPYLIGLLINLVSFNFFIIFTLLPFDKINNSILINFIKNLTNYTGGIYYIHIPIMIILRNYFTLIKDKTFIGSIIVYITCYFICYFGVKIFRNNKFKYLFI